MATNRVKGYWLQIKEIQQEKGCTKEEAQAWYKSQKNGAVPAEKKPVGKSFQNTFDHPGVVVEFAEAKLQEIGDQVRLLELQLEQLRSQVAGWDRIAKSLVDDSSPAAIEAAYSRAAK
jgi:hypothetical protein